MIGEKKENRIIERKGGGSLSRWPKIPGKHRQEAIDKAAIHTSSFSVKKEDVLQETSKKTSWGEVTPLVRQQHRQGLRDTEKKQVHFTQAGGNS